MIDAITRALFKQAPTETLYHYTSLSGLLGIVEGRELRASDIRYMNDSAELRHTLELLNQHVTKRIVSGVDQPAFLNAFLQWLGKRVVSGPMLFGASFRANGNLLSQWRGYSVHGKGVSLGFNPAAVAALAEHQGFTIGRCIYDSTQQTALIEKMVDGVERMGLDIHGQSLEGDAVNRIFQSIEEDLLRIAAVLKHPAFEEEQEWRIVSPVIADAHHPCLYFREGASMLVPYFAFHLAADKSAGVPLDRVYVGPSANADLSLNSLRLYLTQQASLPHDGIHYCQIPYRKR